MKWHEIRDVDFLPAGEVRSRGVTAPDSPWFSGHFPDNPILPGIAQLSMILETLRSVDETVRVNGVRRVRFKQVLRPGDSLDIMVKPSPGKNEGAWIFQIRAGGEIACSGIMTVA